MEVTAVGRLVAKSSCVILVTGVVYGDSDSIYYGYHDGVKFICMGSTV